MSLEPRLFAAPVCGAVSFDFPKELVDNGNAPSKGTVLVQLGTYEKPDAARRTMANLRQSGAPLLRDLNENLVEVNGKIESTGDYRHGRFQLG